MSSTGRQYNGAVVGVCVTVFVRVNVAVGLPRVGVFVNVAVGPGV